MCFGGGGSQCLEQQHRQVIGGSSSEAWEGIAVMRILHHSQASNLTHGSAHTAAMENYCVLSAFSVWAKEAVLEDDSMETDLLFSLG